MKSNLFTLATALSLATIIDGAPSCPFADKATSFFDITVNIIPTANCTCTEHEKNQYKKVIDSALKQFGREDEDTSVVAKVCKPTTSASHASRFLRSFPGRRLPNTNGGGGWGYTGGGACSYCDDDDGDRRGLAIIADESAEEKFDYTVAPEMEAALLDILEKDISSQLSCAGAAPQVSISLVRKDAQNIGQSLFCTDIDTTDVMNGLSALDSAKEMELI